MVLAHCNRPESSLLRLGPLSPPLMTSLDPSIAPPCEPTLLQGPALMSALQARVPRPHECSAGTCAHHLTIQRALMKALSARVPCPNKYSASTSVCHLTTQDPALRSAPPARVSRPMIAPPV